MRKHKMGMAMVIMALLTSSAVLPAKAAQTSITIGLTADVKDFSASSALFGSTNLYYQAVYDSILQARPDGTIIPGLAKYYYFDSTKTILTLYIRGGVRFSDGTSVNGKAVAANLARFKVGKSVRAGQLAPMTSVVAVGNQVTITLSSVEPAMLQYLTGPAGMVESPANFDTANEKTSPVGSGPYILDKSQTTFGSVYTFEANPNYWNASARKFNTLIIRPISDVTAMTNALIAGQIDAGQLGNNNSIDQLKGAGLELKGILFDWVGLSFVDRLGKMDTPIQKLQVRQAINYALDRPAILKAMNAGYGLVTNQVFNPLSKAYDAKLTDLYPYDLKKAKALMKEAGHANGFELSLPTQTPGGDTSDAVVADQLKAIGITVKYVTVPAATFFSDLRTPKYPAFLMSLGADTNVWQALSYLILPAGAWNPEHFVDVTSTRLIEQIRISREARVPALAKKLNAYIVDQAWYAPFYFRQTFVAHKAKIDVVPQTGNVVPYIFNFMPAA